MCVCATPSHVVDPINPGAVDEILNMGQCWNEEGFAKYRQDIIRINKQVGKTFKRAYRFIGAAKLLYDDWYTFNNEALNMYKLHQFKEALKNKLFTTTTSGLGFDRHLFATAFTPNGIVTYIDNLCDGYENIYVLNGGPGTGKTTILDELAKEALRRGYDAEIYHTPLIPDKIEHLLIPELSTAVLTSNEINQLGLPGTQVNMEDFMNNATLEKNKLEMQHTRDSFYNLLYKGLECITQAKGLHDELEQCYIPNMNFEKVNAVGEAVIEKILKYEEDYVK